MNRSSHSYFVLKCSSVWNCAVFNNILCGRPQCMILTAVGHSVQVQEVKHLPVWKGMEQNTVSFMRHPNKWTHLQKHIIIVGYSFDILNNNILYLVYKDLHSGDTLRHPAQPMKHLPVCVRFIDASSCLVLYCSHAALTAVSTEPP